MSSRPRTAPALAGTIEPPDPPEAPPLSCLEESLRIAWEARGEDALEESRGEAERLRAAVDRLTGDEHRARSSWVGEVKALLGSLSHTAAVAGFLEAIAADVEPAPLPT